MENNKKIKECILKNFYQLLQDKEGEVRGMACKILDAATEVLNEEEGFDKVLSYLKILKNDNLAYVYFKKKVIKKRSKKSKK